jgi:hypothetical protein
MSDAAGWIASADVDVDAVLFGERAISARPVGSYEKRSTVIRRR